MNHTRPSTAFKPGQSGNPKGRPKGLKYKVTHEIREAFRSVGDPAALGKIAYEKALAGDGVWARLWLEYGWGKPAQVVTVDGGYTVTHEGFDGRFDLVFGAIKTPDAPVSTEVAN